MVYVLYFNMIMKESKSFVILGHNIEKFIYSTKNLVSHLTTKYIKVLSNKMPSGQNQGTLFVSMDCQVNSLYYFYTT